MNVENIFFKINSTSAKSFNQQGSLYISSNLDWDSFPVAADKLARLIDAQITAKEIGADLHRWQLDFEGVKLFLTFEEVSNSLWLELDKLSDQDSLDFIEKLIVKGQHV